MHRFFLPSLEWAAGFGPLRPRGGELALPTDVSERDFQRWVTSHEPALGLLQYLGFEVHQCWSRNRGSGQPVLRVSPAGVELAAADHPLPAGSEYAVVVEISRGLSRADWPSSPPWGGGPTSLVSAPAGRQRVLFSALVGTAFRIHVDTLFEAMFADASAPSIKPFFQGERWFDAPGFTAVPFAPLGLPDLFSRYVEDASTAIRKLFNQVQPALGGSMYLTLSSAADTGHVPRAELSAWRAYYDAWVPQGVREDLHTLCYGHVLMDLANAGRIVWDPRHDDPDRPRDLLAEARRIVAAGIQSVEDVEVLVWYAEPSTSPTEAGVDFAVAKLLLASLASLVAGSGTVAQPALVRAIPLLLARAGAAPHADGYEGVLAWGSKLVDVFYDEHVGPDASLDPAILALADLLLLIPATQMDHSAAVMLLQQLVAMTPRELVGEAATLEALRAMVRHFADVPPAWFLTHVDVPLGWSMESYKLMCWLAMRHEPGPSGHTSTRERVAHRDAARLLRDLLGHLPLVGLDGFAAVSAAEGGDDRIWDVAWSGSGAPLPTPNSDAIAARLERALAKIWTRRLEDGFGEEGLRPYVSQLARIQHGASRILRDEEYKHWIPKLDLDALDEEVSRLEHEAIGGDWKAARTEVLFDAFRLVLANIGEPVGSFDSGPMGPTPTKRLLAKLADQARKVLGSEAAVWYGALVGSPAGADLEPQDNDLVLELATLAGMEAVLRDGEAPAPGEDTVGAYRATVQVLNGLRFFHQALDLAANDPATFDEVLAVVEAAWGDEASAEPEPAGWKAIWLARRGRSGLQSLQGFAMLMLTSEVTRAPLFEASTRFYGRLLVQFNGEPEKIDAFLKLGSAPGMLVSLIGSVTGFLALGYDIAALRADPTAVNTQKASLDVMRHLGQGIQGASELVAVGMVWSGDAALAARFLSIGKALSKPLHVLNAVVYGAKAWELAEYDHPWGALAASGVVVGSILLATCTMGPWVTLGVGVAVLVGMIVVGFVEAYKDDAWDKSLHALRELGIVVEALVIVHRREGGTEVPARGWAEIGSSTGMTLEAAGPELPRRRAWIQAGSTGAVRAATLIGDDGAVLWPATGSFHDYAPPQVVSLYDEPPRPDMMPLVPFEDAIASGVLRFVRCIWPHEVRGPDGWGGALEVLVSNGELVELGQPLATLTDAGAREPVTMHAPLPGRVEHDHPLVAPAPFDPAEILFRIHREVAE